MIIFIITFIFLYECVLVHVYQCCVNIRVCALHIGRSGHRQRYCSSLFTLFWTRSVHTGLGGHKLPVIPLVLLQLIIEELGLQKCAVMSSFVYVLVMENQVLMLFGKCFAQLLSRFISFELHK